MQTQVSVLDTSLRTTQGGVSINEGFFLAFLNQEIRANTEQEKMYIKNIGINLGELENLKEKIATAKQEISYENMFTATENDTDARSRLNKKLLDAAKIPVEIIVKYANLSMSVGEKYYGADAR